jgi:hypothetical protein
MLIMYSVYLINQIKMMDAYAQCNIDTSQLCKQYLYRLFLKPSGNYVYHLFHPSVIVHSVFMGLLWVSM